MSVVTGSLGKSGANRVVLHPWPVCVRFYMLVVILFALLEILTNLTLP